MTDEPAKKRKREKSQMRLQKRAQEQEDETWFDVVDIKTVAEGRRYVESNEDQGEFRIVTVRWQGRLETRKVLTTETGNA